MSLEAALNENTAAIKQLIAVIGTAGMAVSLGAKVESTTVGDITHTTAEPARRGRKPKDTGAAPAADTAVTEGPWAGRAKQLAEGVLTPLQTVYFFTPEKDVTYQVQPGEPLVVMAGAVEVTPEQYAEHSARIAAKHTVVAGAPGNATAPVPAPAPSPTPAAASQATPAGGELDALFGTPAPAAPKKMTPQEVTQALMALAKGTGAGQGREAVLALVKGVGANDVPSLLAKGEAVYNEVGAKALALMATA